MFYLIEYHRERGRLVRFDVFPTERRPDAEAARLDLELSLNAAGVSHEVVILEAADEDALRRTHRRYFDDARTIALAGRAAV